MRDNYKQFQEKQQQSFTWNNQWGNIDKINTFY